MDNAIRLGVVALKKRQEEINKEQIAFDKVALEKLREYLATQPNKEVVLDEDFVEGYPLAVVYDGGNHPEYSSNAFSMVSGVRMNDNDVISIQCDDDEDYYFEDAEAVNNQLAVALLIQLVRHQLWIENDGKMPEDFA